MTNYKEQKTKPQNHKSLIRKEGCAVMLESGSVFGSTRRWPVLARWRVVALAAALGWAGVCVADAERRQAVGASAVEDVSPCANTAPIQIMTPGFGPRTVTWHDIPTLMLSKSAIILSAAEINDSLPLFRAFVTTVTEHINSRLAKDKLCINGAESMESMLNATRAHHSLLQFVRWDAVMSHEYLVPAMPFGGALPDCQISSPWIELAVYRKPIPHVTPVSQIRGIVRWNKRQMLADQAVLNGVKNVPPDVAMPMAGFENHYYSGLYRDALHSRQIAAWVKRAAGSGLSPPPLALQLQLVKPNKEHTIPPDLLWFYRHSSLHGMRGLAEKSAEGYTKLVLALVDRCFASDERTTLHYTNILDVADPVLLEQYKIDMSIR
jgi:hypothetical protein